MYLKLKAYLRFIRISIYHFLRQVIGLYFGLYLRKIHNFEFFPTHGPCLIVSNHLSYLDSLIISAILKKQYIVILASNEIKKQPIMYWLSKFNVTIFVDFDKSNISYLKNIISRLRSGLIALVYPEGTRSRDGSMGEPKSGFVKIAHSMNVPIVPIAMKGTFDILPPHKFFPKLKRCEIIVGEKIFVNKSNPEFTHCFDEKGNLSKEGVEEIALRIMNKIAKSIDQPWGKSLYPKLRSFKIDG